MLADHNIERGEVINCNSIIGVSLNSILAGNEGILLTEGIFMMEKTEANDVYAIGSPIFLVDGKASLSGVDYMGRAVDVSPGGDVEVLVRINTGSTPPSSSLSSVSVDLAASVDTVTVSGSSFYPPIVNAPSIGRAILWDGNNGMDVSEIIQGYVKNGNYFDVLITPLEDALENVIISII